MNRTEGVRYGDFCGDLRAENPDAAVGVLKPEVIGRGIFAGFVAVVLSAAMLIKKSLGVQVRRQSVGSSLRQHRAAPRAG